MEASQSPIGVARPRARRGSRWAAVLALILPFASAALIVVALFHEPATAALAVALVLLTTAAVWFALTSRGSRRTAATLVAALAFAGLIVVLVLNWRGAVALTVALVLTALFGVCARYAL